MSYTNQIFDYTPEQAGALAMLAPQLIAAYKQERRGNLLTDDEFRTLNAYREWGPKEENAIVKADKVLRGEKFEKFEKLKPGAVAFCCTQKFYELRELFGDDLSMNNPEFREYAFENIQNPFFRLSLEMAANTQDLDPNLRDACKAASVALNERMMSLTLAAPDEAQRENLRSELGSDEKLARELDENRRKQMMLAKTLFLSHFGTMHTVDPQGHNQPYTGSLTETMAHGGRTTFFFAKGEPGGNTLESSLFYDARPDGTRKSAVEKRTFATHAIQSEAGEEGPGAYAEKSAGADVTDNYGMNIAVGGLGNKFGDKLMRNDGKSGHFYIKMHESTKNKGGYLMVGMEGSETFRYSKTGRLHLGGGSAMTSAFVSGKGAPGAKLGGRLVDLSIWDHEALGAVLKRFNAAYGELQGRAYGGDAAAKGQLAHINERLSGGMMTGEALLGFMQEDLGIRFVVIRGREVPVSNLTEYREHHGARNFEALNASAERRERPAQDADIYQPSPEFEALAAQLENAKRYVLGKAKDSPEMAQVKQALDQTILLARDPDIGGNPAAMKRQLQVLQSKTQRYLTTRSRNNERRRLVGRIDALAKAETQRVESFLPERSRAKTVPELRRSGPRV